MASIEGSCSGAIIVALRDEYPLTNLEMVPGAGDRNALLLFPSAEGVGGKRVIAARSYGCLLVWKR